MEHKKYYSSRIDKIFANLPKTVIPEGNTVQGSSDDYPNEPLEGLDSPINLENCKFYDEVGNEITQTNEENDKENQHVSIIEDVSLGNISLTLLQDSCLLHDSFLDEHVGNVCDDFSSCLLNIGEESHSKADSRNQNAESDETNGYEEIHQENNDLSTVDMASKEKIESSNSKEKGTKRHIEDLENDTEDSEDDNVPRATRKKDFKKWTDFKNKKLREQGKAYKGWSRPKAAVAKRGTERDERKMGPRCTSNVCLKSKVRNCQEISEEDRNQLFIKFWSQMNWDQRKIYICSLVTKCDTARLTKGPSDVSRKSSTLKYTLNINGRVLKVCKKFFQSTFGLREWSVLKWVEKCQSGIHPSKEAANSTGRKSKGPRNDSSIAKNILVEFLDSLAKLPSHYCRKSTNKLYLEPIYGHSMSAVYREYHNYSLEKNPNTKPLCRHTFDCIVKDKNIAFQPPKKDKCDICCSYEAKNLDDQTYQDHVQRKTLAREEKQMDKLLGAEGKAIILAQDMQAVKVCPSLNASALYYKTKLLCHNFTVFNINSHHCVCYWFSETEADLTASTFATCIVDYLLQIEDLNKPVIIWSDGCTYQNKNSVLSNALLSLSVLKNITIYQKYLERGHTQMEVDSVHATIERNLKNKSIYLPCDFLKVTTDARKKNPYLVKNINFDFIKDYSVSPKYDSIRPGRRVNDPTVNDIKVIKYTPDGNIQIKLGLKDDFQNLPQRRVEKTVPDLSVFPQLRKAPIKIKKQKWEHLQQLKYVIPKDCHLFYDHLPKSE